MKKSLDDNIHVLFVLNGTGGGATQGIVEFLKSNQKNYIKPFIIIPATPNPHQLEWLNKYCTDWVIIPLNWWNIKKEIPFYYRVLIWGKANLKSGFRIAHLIKIIRLIKKWKIDIVYTGTSLNIEGAIAAKLLNKPHIWHIKETFGSKGRVQFPMTDNLLQKLFLGLSDKVIVMTHYIRSFFGELKDDPRIEVLYDGIDLNSYSIIKNRNQLRKKLGITEGEVLVGMVASLSSTWKNHQLVIHAAQLLKSEHSNIKFAAFGPIPEKQKNEAYNTPYYYFESLKKQVAELGLEDIFMLAGFYQNIPELMDSLDILVHPCETEPFGRISIEAMAAGTPVIGPTEGGIAEVVLHEQTGLLIQPNKADNLAKAIDNLVKNEEYRLKLGKKAKQYISKSQFLQLKHNESILKIFNTVIGK